MTTNCKHCGRSIVLNGSLWIDPLATGDDSIWREVCDSHDTFIADHEPKFVKPLQLMELAIMDCVKIHMLKKLGVKYEDASALVACSKTIDSWSDKKNTHCQQSRERMRSILKAYPDVASRLILP